MQNIPFYGIKGDNNKKQHEMEKHMMMLISMATKRGLFIFDLAVSIPSLADEGAISRGLNDALRTLSDFNVRPTDVVATVSFHEARDV